VHGRARVDDRLNVVVELSESNDGK
jgi:hypothetical protein